MDNKLKSQTVKVETCVICGEKGLLIPPPETIEENERKYLRTKFRCSNNHEFTRYIELK